MIPLIRGRRYSRGRDGKSRCVPDHGHLRGGLAGDRGGGGVGGNVKSALDFGRGTIKRVTGLRSADSHCARSAVERKRAARKRRRTRDEREIHVETGSGRGEERLRSRVCRAINKRRKGDGLSLLRSAEGELGVYGVKISITVLSCADHHRLRRAGRENVGFERGSTAHKRKDNRQAGASSRPKNEGNTNLQQRVGRRDI